MKISNLHFLSKSNIKGNKNSGTITLLICLLTVAITVISCFSVTTKNVMDRHEEDYRARALWLSGWRKSLNIESLKAIESLEHVEVVADDTGLASDWHYEICDIGDAEIKEKSEQVNSRIYIDWLHEKEEKKVLAGKELDEAPVFSCLVPHIFYPFEDGEESNYNNLEYIDGTSLIGKTITIQGYEDKQYVYYNTPGDDKTNSNDMALICPEFSFEIVGTYYCAYGLSGSYQSIFISEQTSRLMAEMAMASTGINVKDNTHYIAQWWNNPELHNYFIVVDDYENIPEVFDKVSGDLGYDVSNVSIKEPDRTTLMLSNIFKIAGTFLTVAIVFIAVFILVQSSVSAIKERRGVIGLMKAIGYKNHQIFASLCFEQMYISLRGALIGGIISMVIIFIANYIFEHGTYRQMQYIIDWKIYFAFLGVSFLIALLVPLITELLLLNKLVNIEPREAMTR